MWIATRKRRRQALKNVRDEKSAFMRRAAVATVFIVVCSLILVVRMVKLQVVEHDQLSTRADENRMRVVPVAPVRGLIYDRNGSVLAQNKPAFVLEVTPELNPDLDALLARLDDIVELTEADVARFKDRVRKTPRYRGVPLRSNLSMEEVARYEVNRHDFRGVEVNAGLTRNYPLGASAAHVIGYVGGITEDELAKAPDERQFQGLSQIGKIGVERSQEDPLRGASGAKIIEANAYGRPLRELDYQRGYPGRNLHLSIDAKVQLVAEQALGELNGAIVALDPRNGEVIALISKPGYEPHLFVEGIDNKTYQALLADPKRPLFNRALQGMYPPGSTIKPAMAIAGLEYGVVDPEHTEYCSGGMSLPGSSRRYRCHKRNGHGAMNMLLGVMKSCDIYFYQLGMSLGVDRIHASMTGFGLGHATGIDLPLEKNGLYPSREWKQRTRKENWYPGETLNIAIGQGYTLTTPMQLAQMTARIAMRGGGFEPHVLHATEDAITKERLPIAPKALPPIQLKDNRNWQTVIAAMEETTHSPGGTAYRIGKDAPYRIASKTGTAQVAAMRQDEKEARTLEETPPHLRDHALFIAFAPVDDPRIAIAVLAEHAGHGGAAASPIARQVMDQYLLGEVRYVPPVAGTSTTPVEAGAAAAAPVADDPVAEVPVAEDSVAPLPENGE